MTFSPRKLEVVLKEVNEELKKDGILTQRLTQDIWTKLMSNLLQGEYVLALPIRQDLQTHMRKKRPEKIYTFNQIIHRLDEILDRYIPPPDLNAVVSNKTKENKKTQPAQNTLLLPSQPHVVRSKMNEYDPKQAQTATHLETKRVQTSTTNSTVQTDREKLLIYTDDLRPKSIKETSIQTSRSGLNEVRVQSRSDVSVAESRKERAVNFENEEISREQYFTMKANQSVLMSTIDDQQMKIKRLEETLGVLEKKNTDLQEEIKTISEIKGDKIDVFSKAEREIKFLRNELKIKEKTLQLSLIERNELLDKLGSVTTSKFATGNTGVTDLSEINKPTQIADKYAKLYHSEWTDSFHLLTLEMKDWRLVIQWLLEILQDAYWYCSSTNESHTKLLMENLVYPFRTSDSKMDPHIFDDVTVKLLTDLKKSTANESVSQIQVHFLKTMQKSKKAFYEEKMARKLMSYIDKSVELCWFMVNHIPAIVLDNKPMKQGDEFDRDSYRFYEKPGSKLDFVVWPSLFIMSRDGFMLHQGVAQAKQEGIALRISTSHSSRKH